MQSLAMLDAILSPEWEYRHFSFNSRWAPFEQMGSMRNGQGDHYFALFSAVGCWPPDNHHDPPIMRRRRTGFVTGSVWGQRPGFKARHFACG